jgi:hypothetical protein
MGLFDRVKRAVVPEVRDPNPVLGGEPGRGEVVKVGRHSAGGTDTSLNRRDGKWVSVAHDSPWNYHEFVVVPVGAGREAAESLRAYVSVPAHRAIRDGVVVPLRMDPASGRVLGLDVAAWEAEVSAGSVERARPDEPAGIAAGGSPAPAAADAPDPAELPPVEGVGFDLWVRVEHALATERVPPDRYDSRAAQLGVPTGRWAEVQAEWQRRMKADFKLAAQFGAAYQEHVDGLR